MTSRWYQEGDQHCMLTASVILQCICIVIVEAFIHNSITTKNILSSQVLITLTPLPHSLLSHSFPCLSSCLTHSTPPPPPLLLAFTPQPHAVPTLSYSLTLLNPVYPYSYYSVTPCHTFLPLLLPSSLIPSLTPLPESLSVSLILSRSLFCFSLSN